MREGATIRGASYRNAGTKLYVSNLDDGVSNEDIKVKFSVTTTQYFSSLAYSGRVSLPFHTSMNKP